MLTLPEGLAPECYPIAWLVGSWRGFGAVGYPNIDERNVLQHLEVDHDGGPYLRFTSTLFEVDVEQSEAVHQEMTGAEGYAKLVKGNIWTTETAYWRPQPGTEQDNASDDEAANPEASSAESAGGRKGARVPIEVVSADPAGWLSLYVGQAQGPRVDLATDAMVRSASAPEVTGATIMYGLVQSDLLWAQDLAAFGQPLTPYASGRLSRVNEEAS